MGVLNKFVTVASKLKRKSVVEKKVEVELLAIEKRLDMHNKKLWNAIALQVREEKKNLVDEAQLINLAKQQHIILNNLKTRLKKLDSDIAYLSSDCTTLSSRIANKTISGRELDKVRAELKSRSTAVATEISQVKTALDSAVKELKLISVAAKKSNVELEVSERIDKAIVSRLRDIHSDLAVANNKLSIAHSLIAVP